MTNVPLTMTNVPLTNVPQNDFLHTYPLFSHKKVRSSDITRAFLLLNTIQIYGKDLIHNMVAYLWIIEEYNHVNNLL